MQPWAKKLVEHQPGQPGGEQPVDDPALSWPAHGGDGDAEVRCHSELGEGGGDPLDDRWKVGASLQSDNI